MILDWRNIQLNGSRRHQLIKEVEEVALIRAYNIKLAGRTGPGYCYRLYSTAVFTNILQQYNPVEILETPLDNLILQMKVIGIKDINQFPFLTPPSQESINDSLKSLCDIGALKQLESSPENYRDVTKITQLGQVLNSIPLHPKFSKLILETRQHQIMQYGLLLACLMVVEELVDKELFKVNQSLPQTQSIYNEEDDFKMELLKQEQEYQRIQQNIKIQSLQFKSIKSFLYQHLGPIKPTTDLLPQINILGKIFQNIVNQVASREVNNIDDLLREQASEYNLVFKSLKDIYYNFLQLMEIFEQLIESKDEIKQLHHKIKNYEQPNQFQADLIAKLLIQSNGLQKLCRLQRKLDPERNIFRSFYASKEIEEIFIHPTSLFSVKQEKEFIVYQNVVEFGLATKKCYMYNNTIINDLSILYHMDKGSETQKKLTINESLIWYDSELDQLMCSASATINGSWEIQNFKINLKANERETVHDFGNEHAVILLADNKNPSTQPDQFKSSVRKTLAIESQFLQISFE